MIGWLRRLFRRRQQPTTRIVAGSIYVARPDGWRRLYKRATHATRRRRRKLMGAS